MRDGRGGWTEAALTRAPAGAVVRAAAIVAVAGLVAGGLTAPPPADADPAEPSVRASLPPAWQDPPPAAEVEPPPIDFERWAGFIVQDLFEVEPHETYVLMADPHYYPELIDAIRAELLEARAVELATILFDGPRVAARRDEVQPRSTDDEYRRLADAATRRLFEEADLFLWLPYRHSVGEEEVDRRRFEHMVEGAGARGLHFHWVQGLERFTQEQVDELTRMYEAALDIDYEALSARQDRVVAMLQATELQITTPAGTDLTMRVPADAWFHKNDGDMSPRRAARARSVRDLQMELPAGALRFIPDISSVEGVLVAPYPFEPGGTIRFEFRDGRVTSLSAEPEDHPFLAHYERQTGDRDRIAELVLGTNPRLPARGPGLGAWPPYYGYGDGILRVALGENWESGGANRSSMEAWFYLVDATIRADGFTIVEDGRLQIH